MNKLNGLNLNAEMFNLKLLTFIHTCVYTEQLNYNKYIYFTYTLYFFNIIIKELLPFQSRFGSFKEEKNFWSFLKVKPKIYQFSYKSSFIFELKFTFCLRASETCQCKCDGRIKFDSFEHFIWKIKLQTGLC